VLLRSTSKHYKSPAIYLPTSNYNGIHHTVTKAQLIYEETAQWVYSFIPADKINILHIKRIRDISVVDVGILLKLRTIDVNAEIARKRKKLADKEKQEILEEEAVVRMINGN
jgi:hypothetical protein